MNHPFFVCIKFKISCVKKFNPCSKKICAYNKWFTVIQVGKYLQKVTGDTQRGMMGLEQQKHTFIAEINIGIFNVYFFLQKV